MRCRVGLRGTVGERPRNGRHLYLPRAISASPLVYFAFRSPDCPTASAWRDRSCRRAYGGKSEMEQPDRLAIGHTAYWTAAVRGHESMRADRLFYDPWATQLAGGEGEGAWQGLSA